MAIRSSRGGAEQDVQSSQGLPVCTDRSESSTPGGTAQGVRQLHVSAANPFSIAAFEAALPGRRALLQSLLAYLNEIRDCRSQLPD